MSEGEEGKEGKAEKKANNGKDMRREMEKNEKCLDYFFSIFKIVFSSCPDFAFV